MKRRPMKKGKDRKVFKKTAGRVHIKNYKNTNMMRGGHRL